MIDTLLELAVWITKLAIELASGKKTEAEARADLLAVGLKITETDSDTELAEQLRLLGE